MFKETNRLVTAAAVMAALSILLAASADGAEDVIGEVARLTDPSQKDAFVKASAAEWQEAFFDPGTGDWKERWFLDGEFGKVTSGPSGIELTAGPEFRNDAHHIILWTQKSFSGDLKIEYDYTRLGPFSSPIVRLSPDPQPAQIMLTAMGKRDHAAQNRGFWVSERSRFGAPWHRARVAFKAMKLADIKQGRRLSIMKPLHGTVGSKMRRVISKASTTRPVPQHLQQSFRYRPASVMRPEHCEPHRHAMARL